MHAQSHLVRARLLARSKLRDRNVGAGQRRRFMCSGADNYGRDPCAHRASPGCDLRLRPTKTIRRDKQASFTRHSTGARTSAISASIVYHHLVAPMVPQPTRSETSLLNQGSFALVETSFNPDRAGSHHLAIVFWSTSRNGQRWLKQVSALVEARLAKSGCSPRFESWRHALPAMEPILLICGSRLGVRYGVESRMAAFGARWRL